MDTRALLCFLFLFLVRNQIQAFKDGAPATSCYSRYPQHGNTQPRLDDPPPYQIVPDKLYYNPQDTIRVTIQPTNSQSRTFKGMIIVAHRVSSGRNNEELVGIFQQLGPQEKLHYISCGGNTQSAVTHKNSEETNSSFVEIKWTAPHKSVGPIVFEATIVETYSIFYVNLKSLVIQPGSKTLPTPHPQKEPPAIQPLTTRISWSECGETKGCLLYPRYCLEDCEVAVSFRMLNDSKVQFEMTSKTGTYVSVGFSDDKWMGQDQTITCTDYFGRVSIQHGYNHQDKYNVRQMAAAIEDVEVKMEDGRLSCRFTRPVSMENRMVINRLPESLETDLGGEKYYLFLATGDIYLSTDTIARHKQYPVISYSTVSVKKVDIYRGSCLPRLIKVHAIVMCLAWMAFAPLAIFTARYYKKGFNHQVVLDTKIWLVIHSLASLMTMSLTVGGLIAVLVHLGGNISSVDTASNHVQLGFITFAVLCLQGVASIYVPGPSSRKRPLFNCVHRLIGTVLFLLAVVTLFDSYDMEMFGSDMRRFCKTSLKIWAGTLIALAICLEGYQYLRAKYRIRKIRSDQYDLDKVSVRSLRLNQEEKPKPSYILYGLVMLFFVLCVVAAICMTVFF